jgi:hypothetical protein
MPLGFGLFTHFVLDSQGDPAGLACYVEEINDVLVGCVWYFDQTDTHATLVFLGNDELLRIDHADKRVREDAQFRLLNRVPA